jgi:hypothetical protein
VFCLNIVPRWRFFFVRYNFVQNKRPIVTTKDIPKYWNFLEKELLLTMESSESDAADGSSGSGVSTELYFMKRAQLCASILHQTKLVEFADLDRLTVFSDYRLPQL